MKTTKYLVPLILSAACTLLASCVHDGHTGIAAQMSAPGFRSIEAGGAIYRFNPATWELAVVPPDSNSVIPVSAAVRSDERFTADEGAASYHYPALGISVRLETEGTSLHVIWSSSKQSDLDWPRIAVPPTGHLILPRNEGTYIPASDAIWKRYLAGIGMNTLEDLNMPFWGVERGDSIITYVIDNPFHNHIAFAGGHGMSMAFTHDFPAVTSWRRDIGFRFFIDSNRDKIVPALHFRKLQLAAGKIRTLAEKAKAIPRIARLIGAPHAYLWTIGPISEDDVREGMWKPLASTLRGAMRNRNHAPVVLSSVLTGDDLSTLEQIASADSVYGYLKIRMAEILCAVYDTDPDYVTRSLGRFLIPQAQWGGGVSTRMIDRLKRTGFDKFLLIATDRSGPEAHPAVARLAEKDGYLFGVYDGYDSIHDPRTAGTDTSWPTAQFDEHYYLTGRITDASGKQLKGFKGIGYQFSPIAAMPAVKQRVTRNFSKVGYSYYFMDGDAFGQYYDDYTPGRMASQARDAQARVDRVAWIASTFKVPVGSEGGSYLFSRALEVAEGVDVPVIGWGDPVFTSKSSKYYLGRYYPPNGPEKFFKSTPLPEEYVHLYLDPRYRLPLYQAVYHDSVITSPHWASSSRKFTNTRKIQAMMEIFYQAAPLYHLNYSTSDAELNAILAHARVFEATEDYTCQFPAHGFRFLDQTHLVQTISYGKMTISANFSGKKYETPAMAIPAGSVRIGWPDGRVTFYTPEG